ncbi:hypothetical protein [Pontibacter cellulosilyticus]|uniref:MG2 domain protein n=1 Tax=Pontibacter cellulosilyticus TaxID=1720253 RepID=A0A923SQ01_9BACT|nr:hypothetical protein [Pontibacter cellulosilyticus]MBC5994660.1 hypothetical protein [Pontibacter cellulosilyticus]
MLNLKQIPEVLKNRYDLLQTAKLYIVSVRAVLCFILCTASIGSTLAQSSVFESINQDFSLHRNKALQEKLFLHIDRPAYACGETIWFKVYNLDGTLHKPLGISKVAYVEVLDVSQSPVLQAKVALKEGTGSGSFVLPVTLSSGNYTVRAYTNWMKNFSPELFFEQPITIINTFQKLTASPAPEAPAYAVQFFPEGGNMVAGVANKVAFKAVDQDTGKGIDFTGELFDQQGIKIATFKPHKFGLGNLIFTPAKGAKYTARLKLPNNQIIEKSLPDVYERGYTLHLEDTGTDRLKLIVNQVGQQEEQVYLLGHTRQMVAIAEAATVNNGSASFLVDKRALAEGITHFTVFNSQKKPVCERLYFKLPAQEFQLDVEADKQVYNTREKVMLNLTTKDSAAPANLSLAVYKMDSLQGAAANTIQSYLWLTSDLKGTIENAGYYFSEGRSDFEAMDNLMLTHGWSRFKWEEILNKETAKYKFLPEYNGHLITGKVTDKTTGAPASGIVTFLASPGKHIRFYNSESNAEGLVRYEVKDFYGDRDVVVQSEFSKDSTYHFEVFNPFSDKYTSRKLPDFYLSETLKQDITSRHVQAQVQHAYFSSYNNRFRSAGVDSTAIYGQASEKYLLDDYKRFKVMEEVMREYVPGVQVRKRNGSFHFMVFDRPYKSIFQENPMVLLDGIPVFDIDKIMAFDPLKVKELGVVTSRFFNGPMVYKGVVSYTTYSGDLAGFELHPNTLMQAYEGLQQQREFYAPSYETEEQKQSRLADFRNLLYWSPEIKTTATGRDKLEFYTSDLLGKYLIVIQGISANGVACYKSLTLDVK